MKAEELMIGDWILHGGKPMQIENGDDISWLEHICQESVVGLFEEVFKPIHITPEFLKKNGFTFREYCTEYEEYVSEDNRIILNHLSNSIGKDWCVHIDNEEFETIGCADIQYVHELQHALRLCRIEKEIEL